MNAWGIAYATAKPTSFKTAAGAILGVAVLVGLTKPSIFYDPANENKAFGTGPNETILPVWMALILVGLGVYVVGNVITAFDSEDTVRVACRQLAARRAW